MTEPRVLIHHSIEAPASEELAAAINERVEDLDLEIASTPPESEQAIGDAEVVLTRRLSDALLDGANRLQWVQSVSAGVDHFDLDHFRDAEIALTSGSGIHAEPIAEQVLGYLLMFERKLLGAVHQQRRGVWESYSGGELRGKTLGIVGLGAIGTRIAQLGSALGMTTIGTKRDPSTAPDVVDEALAPDDLYELLDRSDYVVLACPLTDETRGLIASEELATMSRDAVLVNIARGAVVDQDALTTALQKRHIGGAALDAFVEEPLPGDSPLWKLSNVIVTPHMAGSTPMYWERCAELFAENYAKFVDGELDSMKNRIV